MAVTTNLGAALEPPVFARSPSTGAGRICAPFTGLEALTWAKRKGPLAQRTQRLKIHTSVRAIAFAQLVQRIASKIPVLLARLGDGTGFFMPLLRWASCFYAASRSMNDHYSREPADAAPMRAKVGSCCCLLVLV